MKKAVLRAIENRPYKQWKSNEYQPFTPTTILADSRGDFQSPETEEMKKAVLRAIRNRPYKQWKAQGNILPPAIGYTKKQTAFRSAGIQKDKNKKIPPGREGQTINHIDIKKFCCTKRTTKLREYKIWALLFFVIHRLSKATRRRGPPLNNTKASRFSDLIDEFPSQSMQQNRTQTYDTYS